MAKTPLFTPVLIGGCFILLISFGVRGAMGVFQIPIAEDFGWARSEFSLALAIQNLAWGIGQPIFGAIAEKVGDRKAIVMGIALYVGGMVLSTLATTPLEHQFLQFAVGMGVAGTGFGVILAIIGRASSDENRSMSLAIASATGSVGLIIGPPAAEALLQVMSWQGVFLVFSGLILMMLLALPLLRTPQTASKAQLEEAMAPVLRRAFRDPSYILIFVGFFSCGYQLGFLTSHFPAMVTEMCGPIQPGSVLDGLGISTTSALGALSLSMIGLTNIAGTLAAGWAGSRFQKKNLLAAIYMGRTLVGAAFILTPITPETVVLFSAAMGALWLATVPLTSGLVAHIYGLRYMGTLYGIVFFSHQLGSFLGIWLGGALYDQTGDYTLVWWIGVAVGLFSAIVHLPIREKPLPAQPA